MSQIKLSLSKKLDGGYLHIKKRNSNVKKNKRGGYSEYLKGVKGVAQQSAQQTKQGGTKVQRVVAIKLGGSKKRSPKKRKQ